MVPNLALLTSNIFRCDFMIAVAGTSSRPRTFRQVSLSLSLISLHAYFVVMQVIDQLNYGLNLATELFI